MRDGKGYKLPDPVNPGAYKCLKIFIPADPLYYAAFWTAFEFFGKWLAWERTNDDRGAEAAAIWRTGWNMSRRLWPDMEGDCDMPFELRDDPNDPCKVQQSIDGGTTWFHAFTKGCESVAPPELPIDIATGNIVYNLIVKIAEIYDGGGTNEDVAAYVDGVLFPDPPTLPFDWDVVGTLTPGMIAPLLDPCQAVGLRESLKDCFEGEVLDWLDCASTLMVDYLNNLSFELGESLNDLADAIAGFIDGLDDDYYGERASEYTDAGGGGGAGFGSTCAEPFGCQNFLTNDYDYFRVSPYGAWISGTGWKAGLRTDTNRYEIDIQKNTGPVGTVASIRVDWDVTGNGKIMRLYVNGALAEEVTGGNAGFRTVTVPIDGPVTSVRVHVSQNTLNSYAAIRQVCFIEP